MRTERGPRQRVVASLGKLPGLDREERHGWEEISRLLSGKENGRTPDLFEEDIEKPEWAEVDLNSLKVERIRKFGEVYLGLALWKRLRLDIIFNDLLPRGNEEIEWDKIFCLLAVARFCCAGSELEVAESWFEKTALDDLLGIASVKVNDDRLYRALDRILPFKDEICLKLQERYQDWFGTRFDFLFYDVTSTYFEGDCGGNPQAKRGYSRDKRPDCAQVCVGLVVTEEGLPVAYEIFDGNRADVTTLDEIIGKMEDKYGQANRVWVFDRGIVSEENLSDLRNRNAGYVVGTPKGMLKKFESELTDKGWEEVRPGVEVKTVPSFDCGDETFILCRSAQRGEKEKAILQKQADRLEEKLAAVKKSVKNGKAKNRAAVERRVGRWLGRFTRAEQLFDVKVVPENGEPADLLIQRKSGNEKWAQLANGAYLLRTNIKGRTPQELWKIYMQLNQAENAFRLCKSELGIRPVYHQKENRVQAHILICFLSLAMWKSLELWMDAKGLGSCARKLVAEFREIRSLDVVMNVKNKNQVRLRVVSNPDKHVKVLLQRLELKLPNKPKFIKM